MGRLVIVLGTFHCLQGAEKDFRKVDDPLYIELVRLLFKDHSFDFVFEEVSGRGPTTVEKITGELIGPGRYLDVDPPLDQRPSLGIPGTNEIVFLGSPVAEPPDVETANWQILASHEKREELWLQRVEGTDFGKALMVCGSAHTLSFAFRLQAAGFPAKAIDYTPVKKVAAAFA